MNLPVLSEKPRLRRPARLKYDPTRQTDLLLLPERVVRLNATAGEILRLCDGQRTVAEIIGELETKYNQPDLGKDILAFLDQASGKKWVET